MAMVFTALFMASVPAYFFVQPAILAAWRGGWRKAALAPLGLTVPAAIFSFYALGQDSNLWPLSLIFAAGLGSIYLALLWALRKLIG